MDGLKPERRITGTFLKIREDGEIKLFGLITLRKGKNNEKDIDTSDNLTGI